jgi:hypothetical protein
VIFVSVRGLQTVDAATSRSEPDLLLTHANIESEPPLASETPPIVNAVIAAPRDAAPRFFNFCPAK